MKNQPKINQTDRCKYCPYCGSRDISKDMEEARFSTSNHNLCNTCKVSFEVRKDWYSDVDANNDDVKGR